MQLQSYSYRFMLLCSLVTCYFTPRYWAIQNIDKFNFVFFLFVLLASIGISSHFSYFHLYHYHEIFGLRTCRLRIFRNNSRAQNN